jgi:hypothetical protein
MSVCCPNCTSLIAPQMCGFRSEDHHPRFKDTLQFKFASTSYNRLLKEETIWYLSQGEELTENIMRYLPKVHNRNLIFYQPIAKEVEIELDDEEEECRDRRSGLEEEKEKNQQEEHIDDAVNNNMTGRSSEN